MHRLVSQIFASAAEDSNILLAAILLNKAIFHRAPSLTADYCRNHSSLTAVY